MKFIISAHANYFRLFSKYTNCIIYKYKTYVIQDFVINICYGHTIQSCGSGGGLLITVDC
jgi:hypothetical protein